MMKTITFVLLCMFFCSFISDAQVDNINKDNYSKLDLQFPYDYYSKYNIDFSKYEEYRELGADLKNEMNPNIYEKCLHSSFVVIGEVTKKEYDTRADAYFHSIFTVEPIETIKGGMGNGSGSFKVYQQSGSLGGSKYLQTNHTPLLEVGDKVLMFLERAKAPTGFALESMNTGREKPFIFNIGEEGFILKYKDEISNDFIISNNDVFKLNEAILTMKSLLNISVDNKK